MITMAGFDFGTTTSSAVFARAKVVRNGITGVMEYATPEIFFAAEPQYTPYLSKPSEFDSEPDSELIDEQVLASYIDSWLGAAQINSGEISAGGAIVTGLAAQKENASAIRGLIRARIGDAVIATANDPSLESWLAFMGSARDLSRELSTKPLINLDIGGGTTNIALGTNGQVHSTGCLFIGARHVRVTPGTYRIVGLSSYARHLFAHLRIAKKEGDDLSAYERGAIVDFYVTTIRHALTKHSSAFEGCAKFHEQAHFSFPPWMSESTAPFESTAQPAIAVSGGVGELVYQAMDGELPASITPFGDLGWDLALKIAGDDFFSASLKQHRPKNMGRATAFGLALHNTEISGTTIYLPPTVTLPLTDLPVIGRVSSAVTSEGIIPLLNLAAKSGAGAAIQVEGKFIGAKGVQQFAASLREALHKVAYPRDKVLVFLIDGHVGKAVGSLATSWGQNFYRLVVIDEVSLRDASFVNLGKMIHQIVPVSFYGM